MSAIMTARLVIDAEDRTGTALRSIEARIASMNRAASSLSANAARVGAMSGRVAASQAAIGRSPVGEIGRSSGLLAAAGGMIGVGATIGAGIALHAAAAAGSARVHEKIREQVSGMSADEIREAEQASADLAAKFPAIKQTEIMHMLRNARSIVGSYSEAAEIMQPLAKLRVIAQGARPGADVSEDFDQLVKGLEIKGVTQNPKQFHEYMEGIAKGLNVFGDTLKPYQYYEMFKYGRQATPMLSEKFILSTAPTLAQELGGSSYGKAVAAFNSAIVGGVMKHSAALEFIRLGLVKDNDVEYTKTGDIKGMKAGKHIEGWQLAQTDPNRWVREIMLPALMRAGITQTSDQIAIIGRLFQNQTAAQMVSILTTQQQRIDKDQALLDHAKGLDAANTYQSKDPTVAWEGLKNSLEGLGARWGADMATALTGPMNSIAHALADYTARVTRDATYREEHPGETTLEQKRVNRLFNEFFDGVDSDKPRGETQAAVEAAKATDLKRAMESELPHRSGFGAPVMHGHSIPYGPDGEKTGGWFDQWFAPAKAHENLAGRDFTLGSSRAFSKTGTFPDLAAHVGPAVAELKGSASIDVGIRIEAPELLRAYEDWRNVSASGALKPSNGVSMPEAAPGGR